MRGQVRKGVGRGFENWVNRGLTLKFDYRPKAQEKHHFGKLHFIVVAFFPKKYSDNNFGHLPPLNIQGVGLGGCKNLRIIVR